jgi:hypothetical protein
MISFLDTPSFHSKLSALARHHPPCFLLLFDLNDDDSAATEEWHDGTQRLQVVHPTL